MSNKEDKINLYSVKRVDKCGIAILSRFPQVVLYGYDSANSTWERKATEGALFIYSRSGPGSAHGLFLLNRLSSTNLTLPLDCSVEFMVKDRFLMLKEEGAEIHGLCFADKPSAKLCGRDVQHLADGGEHGALPSLRASDEGGQGLDERRNSAPMQPSPAAKGHKQNGRHVGTDSKPTSGSRKPGGSRRQRLSKSMSEPSENPVDAGAGVSGNGSSPSQPSRSAPSEVTALVRRKLFSGVASPPGCPSPPPPPRPQQVLSLEEVEQALVSHSPLPSRAQTTPTKQVTPGAAILSLLTSTPAVDVLSPVREVPPSPSPSPALPSPLIGTSEDFPDKPPLMVSAGMRSEPVLYSATPHPRPALSTPQPSSATPRPNGQPSPSVHLGTSAVQSSPVLSRAPQTTPSSEALLKPRPLQSSSNEGLLKLMSPGDFSRRHDLATPPSHMHSGDRHVIRAVGNGTNSFNHVADPSGHVTKPSDHVTNPMMDHVTKPAADHATKPLDLASSSLLGLAAATNGHHGQSPRDPSTRLTRDELKSTLVHLLQNDPAFLDSIHQAYHATSVHLYN